MKNMDIGIFRMDTLPKLIVDVVDIGILRPATIPLVIVDYIIIVMLV